MDDLFLIFFSWPFLLMGIIIAAVFGLFNEIIGPKLWGIVRLRKTLIWLEGIKMIWPPVIGFGLGFVPFIPRPEALSNESQLSLALVYLVAGLACQTIVKAVKKAIEARGITMDSDYPPKTQKRIGHVRIGVVHGRATQDSERS